MEVVVPSEWEPLCLDYGESAVEEARRAPQYINERLINGIEYSVPVQTHGKMGEVAFCLIFGLNPATALKWRLRDGKRTDHDCILNGLRVEVKTLSDIYTECVMMWPVGKWPRIFERNQFDVMALMAGKGRRFVYKGWVSKDEFRRDHKIALGHRLIPYNGTPYMEDSALHQPIWPDIPE